MSKDVERRDQNALRSDVAACMRGAIRHLPGESVAAATRALLDRLQDAGLAIVPVAATKAGILAAISAHLSAEMAFTQPEARDTGFIRGLKRGLEMAVDTTSARAIWDAMVAAARVTPGKVTVSEAVSDEGEKVADADPLSRRLYVAVFEDRVLVVDSPPLASESGAPDLSPETRVIASGNVAYAQQFREMVRAYNLFVLPGKARPERPA